MPTPKTTRTTARAPATSFRGSFVFKRPVLFDGRNYLAGETVPDSFFAAMSNRQLGNAFLRGRLQYEAPATPKRK